MHQGEGWDREEEKGKNRKGGKKGKMEKTEELGQRYTGEGGGKRRRAH